MKVVRRGGSFFESARTNLKARLQIVRAVAKILLSLNGKAWGIAQSDESLRTLTLSNRVRGAGDSLGANAIRSSKRRLSGSQISQFSSISLISLSASSAPFATWHPATRGSSNLGCFWINSVGSRGRSPAAISFPLVDRLRLCLVPSSLLVGLAEQASCEKTVRRGDSSPENAPPPTRTHARKLRAHERASGAGKPSMFRYWPPGTCSVERGVHFWLPGGAGATFFYFLKCIFVFFPGNVNPASLGVMIAHIGDGGHSVMVPLFSLRKDALGGAGNEPPPPPL